MATYTESDPVVEKIIETKKEKLGYIIRVLNDLYYMTNHLSSHIFPTLFKHIDKIYEDVLQLDQQTLAAYASYVKPGAYAFRRKSKKSKRKGKKSMRKAKRSARK